MTALIPNQFFRREKGNWPHVFLRSVELVESADKSLRRAVLVRLISDPLVCTGHIDVSVVAGVVILSGHVTSNVQKSAAGATVRRVTGVGLISNEVMVALPCPSINGPTLELGQLGRQAFG